MDSLSKLTQVGNQYSFAVIADPQLGDDKDFYRDWENHPNLNYRMYYQTIRKINALRPAFVAINGDFVAQFRIPSQYRNFVRMTKLFQMPVVLIYGNHDGAPPFAQFFNAQQEISGFQSLYYSFDVGKWHYIALPSIPNEHNPEPLLNWLVNDLQANQTKPTIVFSHYHYMPQGLTQLEHYAQNPIELRTRILDEILRYGNVQYWYTGHVHNGIQTSVKTAWEYRGCNFITVPTTVVARNFGEEYPAFKRGLKKGGYFMAIDINNEAVTLIGQRVGQPDRFIYPQQFRLFQSQIEPRWLESIPSFVPRPFTNGSFEQGLQGWYKVWRYKADRQPGFITRSSRKYSTAGEHSLELTVREKGQHWSNDELTEVYQVVDVPASTHPILKLNYYVDQLSAIGGGYIRIHGYQNSTHQFTMVFYLGHDGRDKTVKNTGMIFHLTGTGKVGSLESLTAQKQVMFWQLNQRGETWHHLKVDVKRLYRSASQIIEKPDSFQADKLFIALGAWNGKKPGSETKIYFDRVSLKWRKTASASRNDGDNLPINKKIYQSRFVQDTQVKESHRAFAATLNDDQKSEPQPTNRIRGNSASSPSGIDTLTGMSGADTFILGDPEAFYYDDKDPHRPGLNDFALITNFARGTDKIEVEGSFTDYCLVAGYFKFGASTVKDTRIFRMGEKGEFDELIAVVQDVPSLSARNFRGLG